MTTFPFVSFNVFNKFYHFIKRGLAQILLIIFYSLNFNTLAVSEIIMNSEENNHNTPFAKSTNTHKNDILGIIIDYDMIINDSTDYNIYRSQQWAKTKSNRAHHNSHRSRNGVVFYSNNFINNSSTPIYSITPTQKNILRAQYYKNKK